MFYTHKTTAHCPVHVCVRHYLYPRFMYKRSALCWMQTTLLTNISTYGEWRHHTLVENHTLIFNLPNCNWILFPRQRKMYKYLKCRWIKHIRFNLVLNFFIYLHLKNTMLSASFDLYLLASMEHKSNSLGHLYDNVHAFGFSLSSCFSSLLLRLNLAGPVCWIWIWRTFEPSMAGAGGI